MTCKQDKHGFRFQIPAQNLPLLFFSPRVRDGYKDPSQARGGDGSILSQLLKVVWVRTLDAAASMWQVGNKTTFCHFSTRVASTGILGLHLQGGE